MTTLIKKHWKAAVILFAIGLVLSFFLKGSTGAEGLTFVADLLFTVAFVYFAYGAWHLIANLDFFAGLTYGTRTLKKFFRGEKTTKEEKKDGFVNYLKSKRRYDDVGLMMILSAVSLALSIALTLILI